MKKLEISRLMDEYQDNEFFPEGGTTADTQAVKELVLAKAAPAKKRRPRLVQVLVAAALAVGCMLMAAAADFPMKAYQLFTGGTLWADVDMDHIYSDLRDAFPEDPLILENGRLWLNLNGERTDITDRIDEETPYVIDATNPETGLKSVLILGGTPEDFGWKLWAELPNDGGYSGGGYNFCTDYVVIDGVTYEETDENEYDEYDSWECVRKPWCIKGEKMTTVFD